MLNKLKNVLNKIRETLDRPVQVVKKPFAAAGVWFKKKFPRKAPKYFDGDLHEAKYIALMAIYAFFVYLFIEEFARITIGPFEGLLFLFRHPVVFLYNVAIIFTTMTLALLFKRRRFAWVIISLIWVALGIVNGGILLKRMTPFTLYDMQNMGDGLTLLTTYFAKWQIILGMVAMAIIVAILVLIYIRSEKWTNVKYKKSLTAIVMSIVFTLGATLGLIKIGVLSTFFGNLNYAYNDYGVPYCFISTSLNKGISKPDGYSEDMIDDILNKYTKNGTDTELAKDDSSKEHPNVIVLQMESFTTAQDYSNFTVDKDPTPVFNSLQDNYTSGRFTVPACGAGTANTEFEVLTGVSARFFGPGEYPYKGKLREQSLQSMGYILKNHGYTTSALHDHRALFYNRNEVYANLGFESFTSVEYMNDIQKTPTNWCKDKVMISDIMGIMKETESRDFMHIISVEGHGSYPTEQVFKDPYTTVSCDDKATKWKYEYYLNECHEMDSFIGELIDEINASGEPTIMLIYGDHIPALDVKESDYVGGNLYKTRYVIWDNIGLAEKDEDISSFESGAKLLEDAGYPHEGVIFDYQQTNNRKSKNFQKYLKALSYDMIYGKNYVFGGTNPYKTVDMRMGHKQIKVSEIVKIGNSYYLKGENFTEHSSVSLDGKLLNTIYLSPTLLGLTEEINPDDIDNLQVSQIDTKDDTILSTINAMEEL